MTLEIYQVKVRVMLSDGVFNNNNNNNNNIIIIIIIVVVISIMHP